MEIGSIIQSMAPKVEVQFASYSTGAATFRSSGVDVVDIGMSESNPYLATQIKAFELIRRVAPDIVVAHEEFAALPAAKMAGLASVFISAWLPVGASIASESMSFADAAIVLGEPGIFPVPQGFSGKMYYAGTAYRRLSSDVGNRTTLRNEYSIPHDALCVVVLPGGSASEKSSPMADVVLSAFFGLSKRPKRLYWVSAKDHDLLQAKVSGLEGVNLVKYAHPIENLLSCADLVITKGTRGSTLDAAAVGVPSISLSPGTNPVDDVLVPRIRTNIALNLHAVDGPILAEYMKRVISQSTMSLAPARQGPSALEFASARLLEILASVRDQRLALDGATVLARV